MSILSYRINGLMHPSKLWEVQSRYGTRVMFQDMAPCPNGMNGCAICEGDGRRKGYHPRPIVKQDVTLELRRPENGQPERLAHRFLTAPLQLPGYAEGEDFTLDRRTIHWQPGRGPKPGAAYEASYQAYAEDWVHMQHSYADFAGGNRKAEQSLNLRMANLEQGMVALSLPANAQGFMCKEGDRFLPVDARMRFTTTVDRARLVGSRWASRHRFVLGVVSAYGLSAVGREVPVSVTFDAKTREFVLAGEVPEKTVIIYDAVPHYTMWLDQGEWRHLGGEDQLRLALLIREEISK